LRRGRKRSGTKGKSAGGHTILKSGKVVGQRSDDRGRAQFRKKTRKFRKNFTGSVGGNKATETGSFPNPNAGHKGEGPTKLTMEKSSHTRRAGG